MLLLRALEQKEQGKQIYLFTGSGCTYQFYAHWGSSLAGTREIVLGPSGRKQLLSCYLYHKQLRVDLI